MLLIFRGWLLAHAGTNFRMAYDNVRGILNKANLKKNEVLAWEIHTCMMIEDKWRVLRYFILFVVIVVAFFYFQYSIEIENEFLQKMW